MTVEADIEELVGTVRKQPHGQTITTDELADLLDLSANRVLALARSGHIPRVTAGRFNRRDCEPACKIDPVAGRIGVQI